MSIEVTLFKVIKKSTKDEYTNTERINLLMDKPYLYDDHGLCCSPFVRARFFSKFHKFISYEYGNDWYPDLHKLEKKFGKPVLPLDYGMLFTNDENDLKEINGKEDTNPNVLDVFAASTRYTLADHLVDQMESASKINSSEVVFKDMAEFKAYHYKMKAPFLYCTDINSSILGSPIKFVHDLPKWLDGINYILTTPEINDYLNYLKKDSDCIRPFLEKVLDNGGLHNDEFIRIWK